MSNELFVCSLFLLFFVRFEQTTAEARKIAEVKEELQKLDAELAADVTILRKEIEAAALNYAHYKYVCVVFSHNSKYWNR